MEERNLLFLFVLLLFLLHDPTTTAGRGGEGALFLLPLLVCWFWGDGSSRTYLPLTIIAFSIGHAHPIPTCIAGPERDLSSIHEIFGMMTSAESIGARTLGMFRA